MIVFEKTRQLARRVPFQRALAARGLQLLAPPEPVRYRSVEEVTDDGPLYVLGVVPPQAVFVWNESPEPDEAPTLKLEALRSVDVQGEQPLYENHESSAQQAWMDLPDKHVLEHVTNEEPDGRQLHAEWGLAAGFPCTFIARIPLISGNWFSSNPPAPPCLKRTIGRSRAKHPVAKRSPRDEFFDRLLRILLTSFTRSGGLVPAAGVAKRLQPFPCSKEVYPVGFAVDANTGMPRPKVAAHYLLEKFRVRRDHEGLCGDS